MKKFAEIKDGMISNVAVFFDDSKLPENHIDVTGIICGRGDHIIDGLPVLKPSRYHTWNGSEYEITSESQELLNSENTERNRISEISEEQKASGLKDFTIQKAKDKVDEIFQGATTVALLRTACIKAFKLVVIYLLK